jgi:hypothetical protein
MDSTFRSADMRVVVELPTAARTHNAARVSDDGRRLEWVLFFGQPNAANVEVSVAKFSPILLGSIGFLVVLAAGTLGAFAIAVRRR